ncbi:MAG TPA: hypothetical protein VJH96_01140 [Patescibacteria group bacterium]|nr:hypothetical protein [Patescibacteria group bacterium]
MYERDKKKKILGYLLSLWFIIPALVFTLYGGMTSDYYVLLNAPMTLYILVYIQEKLLTYKFKIILIVISVAVWSFYIYSNTKHAWIRPSYGGLHEQEDYVRKRIRENGTKIQFNEGDIKSYLYHIWAVDTRLTK